MSLFQRAWQGLNLTPGERAFLRLCEGFLIAGLVTALTAVAPLLSAQVVDWSQVGRIALGTFSVAVIMAVKKYIAAQGDSPLSEPLGQVLTGVATQIGNATGLNEPKTGVVLPNVPQSPTIAPLQNDRATVSITPSNGTSSITAGGTIQGISQPPTVNV